MQKPQFRILDLIFFGAFTAVILVNIQQEHQLRLQERQLDMTSKAALETAIEQGRVLDDLTDLQLQSAAVHNRLEAHTAGCCVENRCRLPHNGRSSWSSPCDAKTSTLSSVPSPARSTARP